MGSLNERQREYLEIVQDSSQRLLDIVSSLLDVARIEAGRLDLVLQPTDLPAMVRRVAAELEAELTSRRQHLTLRHAPELPSILCDPTRAAQILDNLLSNAVKYTPEDGHIQIDMDFAQEEGFLQVSIADDGVGIDPEDQDRLFTRFFRAASAAQTGVSGVGLGLYITRALVELHSGRTWHESEPGSGSTFYVTLPIAD